MNINTNLPNGKRIEVEILVGPSCCGKTEYAQKKKQNIHNTVISCEDIKKDKFGLECVFQTDGVVWHELISAFTAALHRPNTDYIVLDGPFITRHARQQIYDIIKQHQIPCEVYISFWNNTPLKTCLFRNAQRDYPIKDKLIERQFKKIRQENPCIEVGNDHIWYIDWRQGGDDSVIDDNGILPNRILSVEPPHSSSSGDITINRGVRVHKLVPVEDAPEQINPYAEFVLRAREALGADSRGHFRVWPTLKVRWFSRHLKGGENSD